MRVAPLPRRKGRFWQRSDAIRDVLAASDGQVVQLVDTQAATARFVYSSSAGEGIFIADGLARTGSDKTYQLWLIDVAGASSAGLFETDDGSATEVVSADLADVVAVALTRSARLAAFRDGRGPGWRAAFTGLLVVAMASASFTIVAFGILATFLIEDLGITRTQVGLLIAVSSVGAAVTSPFIGRATDRVGGRAALAGLFACSALALLALAAAPVYAAMFGGALIFAIAQSGGNPATNKLIALHLPGGRRGLVTGIKQSGVQASVFLGGLLVPSAAIALGWRPTLVLVAVVPLLAIPLTAAVIPRDRPLVIAESAAVGALPSAIWFLAAYGFLLGFSGGATFLVPLYAEEVLGLSVRIGGAAIGVMGFTATFGRIAWARIAERGHGYEQSLGWIAALSVAATGALFAAQEAGVALLWIGAVLTGLSSSAWNSVGMLAVMMEAGSARAGQASGIVMFGFLTGVGVAPPLFGWTVDRTGSYASMWTMSIVAAVIATGVTIAWQFRSR